MHFEWNFCSVGIKSQNRFQPSDSRQNFKSNFGQFLDSRLNFKSTFDQILDSDQHEPPSVIVWVLYYAAQHFDYQNETEKALQLINEALVHTPTLIELYMVQGRIYKVKFSEESEANRMCFENRLEKFVGDPKGGRGRGRGGYVGFDTV